MRFSRSFLGLFSICFLSACAQQMTWTWNYSKFSDSAMPLNQAQAICQGYAENASAGIRSERAPDNIQCNTNYIGNYASTSCQNNNGWAQLDNNIRANELRNQVTTNYFRSCMAEKGWNANLVRARTSSAAGQLITCKKPDGEIISSKILESTCVNSHKGTPIY